MCGVSSLPPFSSQVILPNNPPWYGLLRFDDSGDMEETEEKIKEIALTILRLYARPKVSRRMSMAATLDIDVGVVRKDSN